MKPLILLVTLLITPKLLALPIDLERKLEDPWGRTISLKVETFALLFGTLLMGVEFQYDDKTVYEIMASYTYFPSPAIYEHVKLLKSAGVAVGETKFFWNEDANKSGPYYFIQLLYAKSRIDFEDFESIKNNSATGESIGMKGILGWQFISKGFVKKVRFGLGIQQTENMFYVEREEDTIPLTSRLTQNDILPTGQLSLIF